MRRWLLSVALIILAGAARGGPPPRLEFEQRPGAALPLELPLRDESGRPVRLGDYFGSLPVVMVFGYFECPNLCSTLLDGVLESLVHADPPARAYRLLAVSIDPAETAAGARHKAAAYRNLLARAGEAHFLTGDGQALAYLTGSAGFPYARDQDSKQYVHPAGFLVATPGGHISRYFLGVRFDPGELRRALSDAAAGRSGSLAERLLLICSHYDPRSGRYSPAAMAAVRLLCVLLAALLACWIWRTGRKA